MRRDARRVRPLADDDERSSFDCGVGALDIWLREHAPASHRSGMTRVYVVTHGERRVIGYYALATSVIEHEVASRRVGRGMPRHSIPALLIARLAVDRAEHGRGLGDTLVRDALMRALNVADEVGVRAVHAHAKGPDARRFYLRLGFEPSPIDSLHLQIPLKTVRASFDASRDRLRSMND